jgi:hypothetical protein
MYQLWISGSHGSEYGTFWDVTSCSSVEVDWCFTGMYCLHLQSWRVNQARSLQAVSTALLAGVLLGSLFDLEVAELHSSKTSIKLQGMISQNVTLFKLPFLTRYILNINVKHINHKTIPTTLTPTSVQGWDWSTYLRIPKIKYQNIFVPHIYSQWTET